MKQDNDRKQKLIDLGPDALADALLNLAVHSKTAISKKCSSRFFLASRTDVVSRENLYGLLTPRTFFWGGLCIVGYGIETELLPGE